MAAAAPTSAGVITLLRVHADRVHDLVRRAGCPPAAAVELVEDTGRDLIDTLARPAFPGDPAGWWFGQAHRAARERCGPVSDGRAEHDGASAGPVDVAVALGQDGGQQQLADALDRQPQPGRTALLLRDFYSLPAVAVGTALGVPTAEAMRAVAAARLVFLQAVDTAPVPPLDAHAVDLATLGRLGEDEAIAAADATTYRHAQACPICRAVVDGQYLARRMISGLSVVPLPREQRDAVLGRLEARARETLPAITVEPTTSAAIVPPAADDPPRSALTPVGVFIGVCAALAVGSVIGFLWPRDDTSLLPTQALAAAPPLVAAPPPAAVRTLPPPIPTEPPQTQVFTVAPDPPDPPEPAEPAPTARADPTGTGGPAGPSTTPAPPAAAPTVSLTPLQGPNNQTLTVTGSGWPAGAPVQLDYLDPTGAPTGAQAQTLVEDDGTFSVDVVAADGSNLPGLHTVRVSDGSRVAETSYDVVG